MNSVNKNTSIATLNKQYFTINYFFNMYGLEINHSNQVTIKASATKNGIATFKYEDLVSIIIPKLICAAQSVDFFVTSMKWGIAPTGINGPIFIDTVNSYSAPIGMIEDIKTIVAAPIPAKVSYSVDPWMDEVDTFNIDLLFDVEEEDKASAALFKWLSHLDEPISWMEITDAFDIDLMFIRDVEEHKYDDYDLAWLFAPAKIQIDASSWIEIIESFDIDCMFALDEEEHKYDECDLTWLFAPDIIVSDEVEAEADDYEDCDLSWLFPVEVEVEADDYEDCDLSWLFPVEVEAEADDYEDCDLSWLFPTEIETNIVEVDNYNDCDLSWLFPVGVEEEKNDDDDYEDYNLSWLFATEAEDKKDDYDDCDLSWLFPVEIEKEVDNYDDCDLSWLFSVAEKHALSWMDEVDDFGLTLLFHLEEKFEISNFVKLCDYLPETEILVSYDNLEDVISETASKNSNTTDEVPTPELSADNSAEEKEDDDDEKYEEYEADVDLLNLTIVKHKATLTILTPISEAINEEDDEEEDEAAYQAFKFITNNNIRTTKWLVLL